ncbi:eukaryotic cytochrome b561 domain-containing protein [Ditylenchus destructor]|uniref:Eukaryotic cytochrome b561 domain-containing protein n=1 Tax=Ditylenchus destructor TaxID=166010 RepID=A0AAD4N8J9_9BILA|nr:eukaryotic cytochrome b561 domain-containing protein [Ditylenchus destructor]
MDYKPGGNAFFANGIGLNAKDALSKTLSTNSEDTLLKHQRHLKYFDFVAALSQVSGIVMIGLAAYVFGTTNGGLRWNFDAQSANRNVGNINLHGMLMTTALVFLQGEGLIVFRLYRHEGKLVAKTIHTILHLLSIVLTTGGIIAIIGHKNLTKDVHFTSHHAWIGLGLLVAQSVHTIVGTVNFWFPKSPPNIQQLVLPAQRAVGITLFLANVGQLLTGTLQYTDSLGDCYDKLTCPKKLDLFLNLSVVATLCYAVCVCALLRQSQWRRQRTPEEDEKQD